VAFAMGEIGKSTRIQSVKLGAPFTYASINGKETAPGQISYADMEMLLLKL
jgi:3-dehydroquinate dehydratase